MQGAAKGRVAVVHQLNLRRAAAARAVALGQVTRTDDLDEQPAQTEHLLRLRSVERVIVTRLSPVTSLASPLGRRHGRSGCAADGDVLAAAGIGIGGIRGAEEAEHVDWWLTLLQLSGRASRSR